MVYLVLVDLWNDLYKPQKGKLRLKLSPMHSDAEELIFMAISGVHPCTSAEHQSTNACCGRRAVTNALISGLNDTH